MPKRKIDNYEKDERKQLYIEAIEKYGIEAQFNQLQEECAELIVSVNKLRRKGKEVEYLTIDELADVFIMVEQITFAMDVENKVQERIDFKINRLKTRLNQSK